MKKVCCLFLVFLFVVFSIAFSSCSIFAAIPTEGVYYCEELRMAIDFSWNEKMNNECVKMYEEDGSYTVCLTHIDYGSGIEICSLDQKTTYLIGTRKYKDDVFSITTFDDETTYVFVKLDEEQAKQHAMTLF